MNKRDRLPAKVAPEHERARVSLVLPKAMKAELNSLAKREVRTLNQQCEALLKRGLEEMDVAV